MNKVVLKSAGCALDLGDGSERAALWIFPAAGADF